MEVLRGFVFPKQQFARDRRVVEPELDMHRPPARRSRAAQIVGLLRRLTVHTENLTEPPKRSVGREIEENWPFGEG